MALSNGIVIDNLEDISDPSDWSTSKFPNLSQLDSSLRCQICKDFLKAPVLTSCGHTFCSICIRRFISDSNKCPICLEETYESGLRKVLLLDSITKWFSNNRSELLKSVKIDQVNDSQDEDDANCELISNNIQILDNDSKSADSSKIFTINESPNNTEKKDDVLAECPICGVFMPITDIQGTHIENCLKSNPEDMKKSTQKVTRNGSTISQFFSERTNKTLQKSSSHITQQNSLTQNESSAQSQLQPKLVKTKQRLANLDTSLSTIKLREKMNLFNIPTQGTRIQMEQRMKEFINLYNANLDSMNPVNDRILLDRLQKWETLINNIKPKHTTPPINADEQTIKRQKIESKEWNNKNKDHFSDLIKQARSNMKKQKNKVKTDSDNIERDDDKEHEQFSDNDTELLL
ncbi:E3 ubiquitin-protein ligase rad18 [Pichia californica]|uniref:Postreplication repair E3 ubiquitin-protein ligase RAD18 n=1 Tax=Pichia californica TaxID=460514 RepID=A0A9P7BH26_9ASCO|nr:E3 ubiquitin-protein ligase rad18 [[Candida] californica]KAG0690766.1 E3 ubiquitin-protein ligase rad18 [[Candida] californica]